VATASLSDAVTELARTVAAKSPLAVKLGKRAVHHQSGMNLAEAYDAASEVMVENMLAADAEEGIAAFIEKRRPNWS
jgi:enoyl-CoA hydratase/carnithine racemase